MIAEPLTGQSLRDALRAIVARPVEDLPLPEQTLAGDQRRFNGRNSAHGQKATVWAWARAKVPATRQSKKTQFKRAFDHDAALAMAKSGVAFIEIAAEFGVTRKSIYRMLEKLWPDRPKRQVVRRETENGI